MRLLIAFLTFMALALAPLGLPAEARASTEHCAEMAEMGHHTPKSEPSGQQQAKSCCTATPAALPASEAELPLPLLHAPAETQILAEQDGLRRGVEVPPPRA